MPDGSGPSRLEQVVVDSLAEFDGQPMTRDLQRRIVKRIVTLYVLRGELGGDQDEGFEPTDAV